MKSKIWGRFWLLIVSLITVVVFMLPYRGVLMTRLYPPDKSDVRVVTPTAVIVNEMIESSDIDDSYRVSEYDELFRKIATPYNIHWCLMSAMAYVESRFDSRAVSFGGARGLMQIMPRIGRAFGVDADALFLPSVNIRISVIHLNDIERMLDLPTNIGSIDRLSLILAGYNGGVGRVFDAQRLARSAGGDPHRWRDVAPAMLKLRDAEWYNNELVKFGEYRNAHYTIYYVRNVLRKYEEYLSLTNYSAYHLYPYARVYDSN